MRWSQFLGGLVLGLIIGVFAARLIAPTTTQVQATADATSTTAMSETAAVANAGDWLPVVKVVDGDTITVLKDGKNETVRLIGVDTPETVDPRKPVQCFGEAASDETKKLLTGQSVRLELDPSQGEFDKYGRTLAYVYAPLDSKPEGLLVNEYLIEEGFGHEYTYNTPYKYQKEFKAAEAAARTGEKGLWAPGACDTATANTVQAAPAAAGVAFSPTKQYDCTKNTYNCSSFSSQAEAQYVFDLCGGDKNDIHKLDSDKDGKVCESLP